MRIGQEPGASHFDPRELPHWSSAPPFHPQAHSSRSHIASSLHHLFTIPTMVSARPPPNPAKGRIAYPSASTYTPGDRGNSPDYLGASPPMSKTLSRDSDKERAQGLKTWWKSFRDKNEPTQDSSDDRQVFGIALAESLQYASVQISTAGTDGELYVWG